MDTPPRNTRFRFWAIWFTLVFIAIATVLLLLPVQNVPRAPQINDKLAHVLLFMVLTLPALVARLARAWFIVLSAAGYGIIIELIQPMTGRGFEYADILANLGGVAVALVLAPMVRRLLQIA